MRMRLINLDRSSDRLALFKARNPTFATVDRFSAIDGKQADRARLIENEVLSPDLVYSDGALGCALSHLTQWRDCIQADEVLTVIEDDAVLCSNFREEAARIIATLPEDWEFIAWGYNFDAPLTYDLGAGLSPCIAHFDQDLLRRSLSDFARKQQTATTFRLLNSFGTVCYSISPRGAARLLQFCMPLRPMQIYDTSLHRVVSNKGIDNMLAHAWPSIAAYVAVPPLAATENDKAVSTIPISPSHGTSVADDLTLGMLGSILRRVGTTDEIAIGFRDGDQPLCTADLRRVRWHGFDIAVHATMLPRALRDRGIPKHFDLLHVGASTAGFHALKATLAEFAPRVIIASVPPELGDEDLVSPLSETSSGLPRGASQRAFKRLAETFGYAIHACPDSDRHVVLLRSDVEQASGASFPVWGGELSGDPPPNDQRRAGYLTSEHYLLPGVDVAATRHGQIAYFSNDIYIGQAFADGGYWDEKIVTVVAELLQGRSDLVLDIGAHIGSHSVFLARANANLRFCCFEPQRPLFLLLERNIHENDLAGRIEAVWSAVGHESGSFAMSATVDEEGIVRNVQHGVEEKVNFGGVQLGAGGTPCPLIRIDDLTLPPICYVKLDVEGAEALALSGMSRTLSETWPLVFFEDREDRRLPEATLEALNVPVELRSQTVAGLLRTIGYSVEALGIDYLAIPPCGHLLQPTCIPRRILQTWKTRTHLPANFAIWSESFRRHNPDYEYIISDDAGNRGFIANNFGWFLPIYDSYPVEIMRADVVRYFQLFLNGGFYADMDAECLRPLDHLLDAGDVVLGRMGANPLHPHCIPNAMMASRPRQEFWLLVIWLLIHSAGHQGSVESRTGPVLLKSAVDLWNANDSVLLPSAIATVKSFLTKEQSNTERTNRLTVLPSHRWYALDWTDPVHQLLRQQILQGELLQDDLKGSLFGASDMVTYWSHSW